MKRLFGTDGIRAVAGEPPLDPAGVRRFGAALADVLRDAVGRPPRILLGRDTRESGPWLRDAVAHGAASRGAEGTDAGVITTPGLAWLVRESGFDGGVMISASHNPFEDNGLKAFDARGVKLSDALETRVESELLDASFPDPGGRAAAPALDADLLDRYVAHLSSVLARARPLAGMRLALDCANGSASAIAPRVFGALGAELHVVGAAPDGRNINLDCGSLHLERLGACVREHGCDAGLAFDGDADRCLAVDRRGRVVDGDHILFITGRGLARRGQLRGGAVVATVMSNYWLEERLGREGLRLHRAPVGDKYVLERMQAEGLVLGGEQSGHVIFLDHATTGDGLLTGLLLLDALAAESEPLESILDGITPYPQLLLNVRVREKPVLHEHPRIGPVVADVERELEGRGRIVLRYSGTEPLARVMVEAETEALVRGQAERLAAAIRSEIGER